MNCGEVGNWCRCDESDEMSEPKLPTEFGVKFITKDGTELVDRLRWTKKSDAEEFGRKFVHLLPVHIVRYEVFEESAT